MLARPPPHARLRLRLRTRARTPTSLRTRTRTRETKKGKSKITKPKYGKSFYPVKTDPLKKALKPGAAPADTLSVSQ